MNDQEKVFKDPRVDDITTSTGVIDERDALSIDEVDDATLVRRFKYWVNDSEAYWNSRSGFNLRNVRAQNERYYLGKQDSDRLYYHQADYRDNQLFVGIQAVIAYVSARDPGCERGRLTSQQDACYTSRKRCRPAQPEGTPLTQDQGSSQEPRLEACWRDQAHVQPIQQGD